MMGKKLNYYETYISIAKKDARGNIHQLLGVQHDVTAEQVKKNNANEILMRYHTVFNSSLIDMFYYDKEGVLKEINETACNSLKIHDKKELLQHRVAYDDNPLFNHIDYRQSRHTVTSGFVDFAKYKGTRFLDEAYKDKKLYYEASINTIHDKHGNLDGIYIIGRDITEMVESFHQQQQGAIQLKKATQHIHNILTTLTTHFASAMSDWLITTQNAIHWTYPILSANHRYASLNYGASALPHHKTEGMYPAY